MEFPMDAQVHLNFDDTLKDPNIYIVDTNFYGDIILSNNPIIPVL